MGARQQSFYREEYSNDAYLKKSKQFKIEETNTPGIPGEINYEQEEEGVIHED